MVEDIGTRGGISLRAIAPEMKGGGILIRRGGRWHVSTVTNRLARLDGAPKTE